MITNRPHLRPFALFGMVMGILALAGFMRIDTVRESYIARDLWKDSHIYFTYAYNLRHNGVYSHYNVLSDGVYSHSGRFYGSPEVTPPPDDFLAPGYPIFVYLFLADIPMHIDRDNIKPYLYRVKLAQAVLSTATVLITYLVSRYVLGAILALAPTLIVAMAPHLIIANLYILTETLFCFMLSLTVLLIGWSRGKSPVYTILVGALIGAASLVKPAFLYFIAPFCLVYVLCMRKEMRGPLLLFLMFGFAVVYAPWVIRNHMAHDIVSEKNLMASTLLAGAYPDLVYGDDQRTYPYPFQHDPDYEKNSRNISTALSEIWRRFSERPTQFLRWYLVGKPTLFLQWDVTHGIGGAYVYPVNHSPYSSSVFYRLTYDFSRSLNWPLVMLGLIGCTIAWLPVSRRLLPASGAYNSKVISLIVLYFLVVHAVTFADARYAVPLRPILAVMAFMPLRYLWLMGKKTTL